MTDDSDVEKVPSDVQAALLEYPNVVGVGFGEKETGGRMTGEQSVVVFVSRKVEEADLEADDVVPTEVEFGGRTYRTDVVESGPVDIL
jgi:hypothetical protein